MTSRADTLRDMAEHYNPRRAFIRGESGEQMQNNLTALLAGAAAIDTLTKVREVLDILDKRSDAAYRAHNTNPEDAREDGKAIAYEQAVNLIQNALGGTP